MMTKYVLSFLLIVFLSGCATTEYYTNPQSAGYNEQGLGGLCENCGRQFNFSGYQLNNYKDITCPYCGRTQNIQMAANRWTYAVQQQQTSANQQALMGMAMGIQQANQQRAVADQQNIQNFQNNINRQGTYLNPIYVKEKQ